MSLQEAFKVLGWSQKRFAEHAGYSQQTVSQWCTGQAEPPRIVIQHVNLMLKMKGWLDGQEY
jgi:transcriptional regulator with XRE-family HTH domain